jgi:hypothetical protein
MSADKPKEAVATIVLVMTSAGTIEVSGAILDPDFAFQMLDSARGALVDFHTKRQTMPVFTTKH